MKLLLAAAALTALAAPAAAQTQAAPPAAGSERINQLIVYGDDPCPQSSEEQINVCARKPESERYRIPEALRGDPNDPANQAWASKATELQYVGRSGIGSCSTVGPGGMIGCFNDIVRQARAERAGRDEVNWNRLIEEARQERLGRIDAEAAAVEAEQNPPK
ncbi:hypothetical protein [Sphingosinicella sp. BN140058]|uniref:hypothetical protein n=1 Tax=Sphingosinicella sp. BN140058 TaxID=1892855 RepID=UPI0010106F92|nr:hypothetical protein [Sphingosinicella sp. BN140058]QAY75660.1 hypothetical protein ETR14_03275 [Sphingosinicella sp. BN140058]